jgi:pimeloyl-ACP methyl ester carboxylesterase
MRRFLRLLPALLAVALIAGACADISAEDEAALEDLLGRSLPEPSGDPFVLPEPNSNGLDPDVGVIQRSGDRPEIDSARCGFERDDIAEADCGEITLPGRGEDDDYEITLSFARFNATGPAAEVRPDPVVYLHGGPGGSIVDDADFWYESIISPHTETRDVILYDQRGGGRSTDLPVCHEATESSDRFHASPDPHDELAADFLADLASCSEKFARGNHDTTAFNSRINAEDLIDLLWALGVEQYNLHGSSYGSRLAQTVMRDSPEGVRSVILSGAYPIDANLMGSIPVSIETALTAVFDGCVADETCNEALPDPWQALEDLVTELDAEPLGVDLPLDSDNTYETYFDGTDLLNGLHSVLYVGEDAAEIPDLLIDWADGDQRRVLRLARGSVFDYTDTATFLLVQCADEGAFADGADLDRPLVHEFLRAVDLAPSINGSDSLEICADWDTGDTPSFENDPVTWDAPTLIFAGAADPITPPLWAEQLAERLPRGRLIHRADLSHDSDDGWCSLGLITAFVEQPDLLPDISCAATPATMPMPNLAERLRTPFEISDGTVDLNNDGEFVDVQLPNWWSDWQDDAHIRWRDLDVFDPTAVIIRAPESEYDLLAHIPLEFSRDPTWTITPSSAVPDGWFREVLVTTAGSLTRWTNSTTGANITLVTEPGESPTLEDRVLRPLATSLGDDL